MTVLNGEMFYQAPASFAMFDDHAAARNRRLVLLREISIRHKLMIRAKRSSETVIDGKFVRLSKLSLPR